MAFLPPDERFADSGVMEFVNLQDSDTPGGDDAITDTEYAAFAHLSNTSSIESRPNSAIRDVEMGQIIDEPEEELITLEGLPPSNDMETSDLSKHDLEYNDVELEGGNQDTVKVRGGSFDKLREWGMLARSYLPSTSLQEMKSRWKRTPMRVKVIFGLILSLSILLLAGGIAAMVIILSVNAAESTSPNTPETYLIVETGGVAGDCHICAQVGRDILQKKNGNAVDAAIATCICVGVVQPFSSGIGGGLVMNILMNGTNRILDAREKAPEKAYQDMFVGDPEKSSVGPLSIAIPAEIKGLGDAWKEYGSVPWKDLITPSIQYAESIQITELDRHYLEEVGFAGINASKGLREQYIHNDEFVPIGWTLKRPQLAATLTQLAREGPDSFYTGTLAQKILSELSALGSILTPHDLASYSTIWRAPVVLPFLQDQYELSLTPAPFGGLVDALALNIVEPLALQPGTSLSMHHITEAWKWAYDDRFALSDPEFSSDAQMVHEAMASKTHAAELRLKISDDQTFPAWYYSDLFDVGELEDQKDDHGTMHLNVVDRWGNLVALTSTVNLQWGSRVVGDQTGIVYNDQMDDFSTPGQKNYFGLSPSPANYIAPGKRPLSSMSPVLVRRKDDGKPLMAAGGSGGSRIITATMQILLNKLLFNETLGDAVNLPRFHHQLLPNVLRMEKHGFSSSIIKDLQKKGHEIEETIAWLGVGAAIYVDPVDNSIHLASDHRKSAGPAGY